MVSTACVVGPLYLSCIVGVVVEPASALSLLSMPRCTAHVCSCTVLAVSVYMKVLQPSVFKYSAYVAGTPQQATKLHMCFHPAAMGPLRPVLCRQDVR
jgi:hypothetical protein